MTDQYLNVNSPFSHNSTLDRIAIPAGGLIYLTAYGTPLEYDTEEMQGQVLMVNEYLGACKWIRKAVALPIEDQPKAIVCELDFLDNCGDSILAFRNSDPALQRIPFLVIGTPDPFRERFLLSRGVQAILPMFFTEALLKSAIGKYSGNQRNKMSTKDPGNCGKNWNVISLIKRVRDVF